MKKIIFSLCLLLAFSASSLNANPNPTPEPQPDATFSTGQSVQIYLMSNSFKGDDGITLRVNSDLCVCANGTPVTGAIQIVDYSSTKAVFKARNPHKGLTMTFTVDADRGILYYHEANAYYYRVR